MGTFLIVLGALVAVLCGGCTLLALSEMGLNDPFTGVALVVGGVPFAVGIGLLCVGIAVNKHKEKRAAEDSHTP